MEEEYRLKVQVVDEFTTPLKSLQTQIGNINRSSPVQQMNKDWKGIGDSIAGVTRNLGRELQPALSAIGVSTLGVTGIITGLVAGVNKLANAGVSIGHLSRELGLSQQRLKEFETIGKLFDFSPGEMAGALRNFQNFMDDV